MAKDILARALAVTNGAANVNALTTRVDGHDTAIAGKANQADLDATNAQLAEKVNQSEFKSKIQSPKSITISSIGAVSSFVTFVDDDGYTKHYTDIAPLLESKGFRGVTAVITGAINTANKMTGAQLRDLQSRGHEIASHSHDHLAFDSLTSDELDYQCKKSRDTLIDLGIQINNMVYAFGQTGGAEGRRIVKKYYKTGITTNTTGNTTQNSDLKNEFELYRVQADTETLDNLKARIDDCKANNTWLIFMIHSSSMAPSQLVVLSDLMDYINSQGVTVGTINDALNKFGNSVSIGGKKYIKILGDGDVYSNAIGTVFKNKSEGYNIDLSTPIKFFEKDKFTYSSFFVGNGVNFPGSGEGVLETFHCSVMAKSYQKWTPYNSNNFYIRKWTGTIEVGSWDNWRSNYKSTVLTGETFAANETKTYTIDLSDMGPDISTSTGVLATCRNGTIDNFSYSVRISNATTAVLRMTNVKANQIIMPNADWDIRLFR